MKKLVLFLFTTFSFLLIFSLANASREKYVGIMTKTSCVNGKCMFFKKNLSKEETRFINMQMDKKISDVRRQIEERFLWLK